MPLLPHQQPISPLTGEKNKGIRNAALLPVRLVDRRPRTGRPGPGPDSLAGALLPKGLPALGRPSATPCETTYSQSYHSWNAGNAPSATSSSSTHWPTPWKAPKSQHRTQQASTPGAPVTCPTTAAPSPNFPTNPRPGTHRCTPRATWLNARPSSPSAQHFQRTRTCSSSAGTTTRTGSSPGTSQVTTLASRQGSSWGSKTGEPSQPRTRWRSRANILQARIDPARNSNETPVCSAPPTGVFSVLRPVRIKRNILA